MPSHPSHEELTGAPGHGEILADKYRVERVLGSGAMGIVVAALHLELGERVALKFLLPEAADNPEVVARFAREARAAARIKSEYVARVTDVGKLASGAPYMVMEYLDGNDLADVLGRRGPIPVREATEYVLQACAAVAEAHALGIIHRDLKPANLFLANRAGGSPVVKVLDFGISKIVSAQASSVPFDLSSTRTSAWLGSPLYMSPEQMTSAKSVDMRTDIWSLGTILFELLTGRPPFDAPSLPELFAAIQHGPPPSLEAERTDAPPGLGAVIRKCLERNLDARYASVAELATALVPFAPRRARSVAEHAVAVSEAAGIAVVNTSRRPLDSTLPGEGLLDDKMPSQPEAFLIKPGGLGRGDSVPVMVPVMREPTPTGGGAMVASTGASSVPAATIEKGGKSSTMAIVSVIVGVAVAAGAAYYFVGRGHDHRDAAAVDSAGAPTVMTPAPTAAAVLAAPPEATIPSPTPVVSAVAPLEILDAGAAKGAALTKDAGAAKGAAGLRDAGAPGHVVGAALGAGVIRAAPRESPPGEAATPSPIPSPTAGTAAPSGLDVQHCFATLPNGTRTQVPCAANE